MKYKWLLFLIIPISAFADDLITSNIINGCSSGLSQHTFLLATFTPNQYQCSSGYYVPANNDGCVICPDVYDCSGGTFTFNEKYNQGNKIKTQVNENIRNGCKEDFLRAYNNNIAYITATFTPNVHNCNQGYYLPANIDECTKCLNDHYCPGGTYTFNETIDQGMNDCPSAHPFAPAGMWQQSQCGRKLHIGDDILYMHQMPANPTVHRLYIGHPNGIYSANTVARDLNSNTFPKMSEGMSKGFHVTIDNVEYLICDDSVLEYRNTPQ